MHYMWWLPLEPLKSQNKLLLPTWFIEPKLSQAIKKAWLQKYDDFYLDEGEGDVEETVGGILKLFGNSTEKLTHHRYVCMGYMMGVSTLPTVRAYLPEDNRLQTILSSAETWEPENPRISLDSLIDPNKEARGNSSITDTYYLFHHLAQLVSGVEITSSIEEILYYSLLGDAITPVPSERRQVFNWWLINVVPSAYHLKVVNLKIFRKKC